MTSRAEPAGPSGRQQEAGPSGREREAGRANVVGVGLIGGSIGLALRDRGWHVTGSDLEAARLKRALELGALDDAGTDPRADITFVATTVGSIGEAAIAALAAGPGVVTDVGSVKAPVIAEVGDPRFVGGHPMAGSEQEGVEGAQADLFEGATWVLTPTLETDAEAYTTVRSVVRSLGAEVVALPPER
ncbi:MAG TPA: prephenate dehydrogenase/arogenate dehydrogenase family protein, partial [Jatrophihabitans sp.]